MNGPQHSKRMLNMSPFFHYGFLFHRKEKDWCLLKYAMSLLDQLWDDTLAGPQPDSGLGRLRKHSSFTPRSTTSTTTKELDGGTPRSYGEESAEERPRVTRSITIVRPPGYQSGEGSPLVSPAGSTPPVSPFFGGKESFRFRRRSASEAYEKARGDVAGARSPRPSDDV